MSEEKSQNVPVAEAQKQENAPKADLVSILAPPAFPVDIQSIPKDKIEMAESFGIPIGGILQWVAANAQWQSGIAAVLGKLAEESSKTSEFIGAVQKRAAEIEQKRQQLATSEGATTGAASPPGIAGMLSSLPQLVDMFSKFGGQSVSSPLQDKFNLFLEKQIDNLLNPQPSEMERLGSAMVNAITSKVGAKTAETIATAIGPVS